MADMMPTPVKSSVASSPKNIVVDVEPNDLNKINDSETIGESISNFILFAEKEGNTIFLSGIWPGKDISKEKRGWQTNF